MTDTTVKGDNYKQEYLTLDDFMKLRYEEIYGRKPEPSDTDKVITDVKALSNTQILDGGYNWWAPPDKNGIRMIWSFAPFTNGQARYIDNPHIPMPPQRWIDPIPPK